MDELKRALENLLSLLDEFVPSEAFENGTIHQGIDKRQVLARRTINGARLVLSVHMTEAEKENSPVFFRRKIIE